MHKTFWKVIMLQSICCHTFLSDSFHRKDILSCRETQSSFCEHNRTSGMRFCIGGFSASFRNAENGLDKVLRRSGREFHSMPNLQFHKKDGCEDSGRERSKAVTRKSFKFKLSRTYEAEPACRDANIDQPRQGMPSRLKGGGVRQNKTIFVPSDTCKTVKDGVEEVCKGDLAYVKAGVHRSLSNNSFFISI